MNISLLTTILVPRGEIPHGNVAFQEWVRFTLKLNAPNRAPILDVRLTL